MEAAVLTQSCVSSKPVDQKYHELELTSFDNGLDIFLLLYKLVSYVHIETVI